MADGAGGAGGLRADGRTVAFSPRRILETTPATEGALTQDPRVAPAFKS